METLEVCRRLVPEIADKLRVRYRVLRRILLHQPIGRRSLAQALGVTERILRADVEFFKEQGLIDVGPLGMSLTDSGLALVGDLHDIVRRLDGRDAFEQTLGEVLGIRRVVAVAGDSEEDPSVMRDIGYAAAQILRESLQTPCTVGVTGGSTMAALADVMPRLMPPLAVEVLPARGGLGERVELLANTIASRLADKLGGTYRMFHVPESLSRSTAQQLALEPAVSAIVERIRSADVVVHGIGDALAMARRRGLDAVTVDLLRARGAVAEAFGYFFDGEGQTVHVMNTVGLRLEDLTRVKTVIAVAGGAAKSAAIRAAARAYRIDALITDEGAARAMLAGRAPQATQVGKREGR